MVDKLENIVGRLMGGIFYIIFMIILIAACIASIVVGSIFIYGFFNLVYAFFAHSWDEFGNRLGGALAMIVLGGIFFCGLACASIEGIKGMKGAFKHLVLDGIKLDK